MSRSYGTVGIVGATGFIGRALGRELSARGWRVVRFSRQPLEEGAWRSAAGKLDLGGLDAVVNLAGESVAQRWTRSRWERIENSRVELTRGLVQAIEQMASCERPRVLLNSSAVGIYPSSEDEELREDSALGTGRMAGLCRAWEAAALEARNLGLRVVPLRTGIVLGKGGDAWERLRMLFSWGLGGRLGSGQQWMPWIHLADEVAAIIFALESEDLSGPLNLCAPNPVTNREFTKRLGGTLDRPAFCHAPGPLLSLILGGFAKEGLLASCRALPVGLEEQGFNFKFPTLQSALDDLRSSRG
jgi:uncharacterized protein (TIGR01777 family)